MYIPRHFKLVEFLPQQFFEDNINHYGDKLWLVFDQQILKAADLLREKWGPLVANTWYHGGRHQYRGFRDPDCNVGAKLSQHRFGRALDLVPRDTTAQLIRADLKKSYAAYRITCIEENVSWLHIDRRNHLLGLKIVYP